MALAAIASVSLLMHKFSHSKAGKMHQDPSWSVDRGSGYVTKEMPDFTDSVCVVSATWYVSSELH